MNTSAKKYLVIGANSFIGKHLIANLKIDNEVVGVYHENRHLLFNDIVHWKIDDLDKVADDFDVVYIVSAYIPHALIDNFSRRRMYEVNVELVGKICLKYAKSRIIFCSSVSVYKQKEGKIQENDSEAGMNEYGISKLWGEKVVEQANNYAIVRFSSVYGEGMKLHTIIPNYIKQALAEKKIKVFGDGKRMQNYICVDDAVSFLKSAGNHSGNSKFLAVSEESISNKNLAAIIAQETGSNLFFEDQDKSASFIYDNNYTRKVLGCKCEVSLVEGISNLIKWIKKEY